MKAALIIPAFNEELSIGKTIDGFLKVKPDIKIIVCDNGSQDKTAELASKHGAQVVTENERGYGIACQKAISALPADCDIVIFADGDCADNPKDLDLLLNPIVEEKFDFVLGSRMLRVQQQGALTPHARFGNWLATTLIRMIWKVSYTDLGPFRAIKKEALEALEMRDRNFGWTIEMQIKAIFAGLKIKEVDVAYRKRIGKSKVSGSIKGSFLAGVIILRTIFTYWRRKTV